MGESSGPLAVASMRARMEWVLRDEGLRTDLRLEAGGDSVKGEHFMSSMHRIKGSGVTAEGSRETIPFVAKVPVKNEAWREKYGTHLMFRKEMDFYNVILPAYVGFQVSHGRAPRQEGGDEAMDGLEWVPRCYCTISDDANSMVLMEDLSESGYRMEDRMVGLDLEKSLLVMQSLGKLHAFSYSLQQKDPVTFQSLTKLTQETWMTPDSKGFRESVYQEMALAAAAVVRERCPEAGDKLTERLQAGLYKLMTKAVTARDRYSVINHGDVWINNLLFRRRPHAEDGWDVKFVDYQMVRYCSPAADLSYFLLTSVERGTREQYFDHLLREYHGTLVRWLDRFDIPTLRSTLPFAELEDQMRSRAIFGVGMALAFLPMYYVDARDAPDVEGLEDESFSYLKCQQSLGLERQAARENLVSVVKLCCDRGYI